ncbi:exocyst complex component Sec10-domain-containing protein [Kockovaella imperatae]|uniref:Exocyst complex component Sec10-domain-containing protein n=1 Tax=Kockovaella imperatae TaxID=4999 RepID=A0A1Y1U8X5_9TREE|nr:exocyst complex component Sec10-domain-containing protein [Kockovaella imperatae]ORX34489.1 exocyst complex component Sec10-domain-containing protein [Kockovaella imperatae]
MASPVSPPKRPAKRQMVPLTEGMASPLRPKADPVIEKALQLSTFESNYSTEDFIGTLSENVVAESKASSGPFDPRPFISVFSPALDSLLSLRQQVAERTRKMESDVRRAEREYGKRLRELDGGFEAIGSSFSNLESKITDVSRTAVRIGEQLDALHQTRSTAQSTSLLVSYYLALVHHTSYTHEAGDPKAPAHPLEALFETRTSREGRTRLSIILRRLMAVAKDMADNAATAVSEAEGAKEGESIPAKRIGRLRSEKEKAERVRDEVERYCERFEKEVLRLFDRSYRKGDPRMMAHCARTLQDFNGGASCVQIYVNQHDFFMSKDRVLEEAEKQKGKANGDYVDIWETIGDPDASAPLTEPGTKALFKEIRITVSQEAQIVKAVFPDPISVMKVFIQRVFAQVVEQHLEALVSRATAISTLAVLRVLNVTHSLCSALVEDLKAYDAALFDPASRIASTTTGTVSAMLDHVIEGMFVPWLEGQKYMESESKNLVELYAGLLSRFTRYHETVLKAKPNSLLDKVVHQLSSSNSKDGASSTASAAAAAISKYANVFTSSATSYGQAAAARVASPAMGASPKNVTSPMMNKTAVPPHLTISINTPSRPSSPALNSGAMSPIGRPGLSRNNSVRGDLVNKGLEEKVWATDGVLTLAMAERMLKWHAEAVGRVVELCPASDVAKNAFALFKVLAEAICRSLIETALDSAVALLENQDSKAEPDLTVMGVLKPADLICQVWQRYTTTALFPLTASSAVIRREMGQSNTHHIVRLEGKINSVIQKSLDSMMTWLSFLLTKQKKNDYKPKDDDLSFARTITEPCELSCQFLETVKDAAFEGLSGKNIESFLMEVGVAFHALLLEHYKKFPVNPTGGLMLTKDLASYQEVIATFGLPALNYRFEMLRQLGNSFIVQPNVLKSYLTEGHLGRIESRLLRPYLAQRSDWNSFNKTLVLDDGLPAAAPGPETQTSQTNGNGIYGASGSGTGSGNANRGMFKGSRFSAMSGVAGAGMGKLKELLKEFEAYTPEELEAIRKSEAERAARLKANPELARSQALFASQQPVYFGLH